jgi:hypothetical protein
LGSENARAQAVDSSGAAGDSEAVAAGGEPIGGAVDGRCIKAQLFYGMNEAQPVARKKAQRLFACNDGEANSRVCQCSHESSKTQHSLLMKAKTSSRV